MHGGQRLLLVPLVAFLGCASSGTVRHSQLELREFQTRSFDERDVMLVMKAVANVMQDEGFIITQANSDLGLISGSKEMDVESAGGRLWAALFAIYGASSEKTRVIDATGNITGLGSQTKVRMTFQTRLLDNRGRTRKSNRIEDAAFYKDFFEKTDKAIFLQKEKVG